MGDEEANIIPENGGVSIQKVRGQIDHDGEFCEFLQKLSCRKCRVIGSPTANQQQSTTTTNFVNVVLKAFKHDGSFLKVHATPHRIDHGLWLLENLLLHERGIVFLHNLLDFHFEGCNLSSVGIADVVLQSMDGQQSVFNCGHVVVFQVKDTISVFNDCGCVGRKEIFHFFVLP